MTNHARNTDALWLTGEGKKPKEIAAILGVSPSRARQLISNGYHHMTHVLAVRAWGKRHLTSRSHYESEIEWPPWDATGA